ncbi:hypothetical protein, partial [[Ruminococcus] torques]|uniref:hypothetical protein n=1 Tax=[Ruminococcus] torques TaxID=33039 RepID=UPI0032C12C43
IALIEYQKETKPQVNLKETLSQVNNTYVIRRLDRTGDECYATKEIPSKILGNPFCNIKNKEIEYFY